jgi:hypothetical protein
LKLGSIATTVIVVAAVAALTGWAVHSGNPSGMVLPQDAAAACPKISHGFAFTYAVIVGIAAGSSLVIGVGIHILSMLGIFGRGQVGLQSFARSCFVAALAFGVLTLARYPIESMWPLPNAGECGKVGR